MLLFRNQVLAYFSVFSSFRDVNLLNLEHIFGFILNIPSDIKLGVVRVPIQRKHWIAVRQIDGCFYNLDSKLPSPKLIGSDEDLRQFLSDQVGSKEKQLLLVVEPDVAQTGCWINETQQGENVGHSS